MGALNSASDGPFYADRCGEPWTERYEDLRRQALSPGATLSVGGWGLALVIRSGLVAWMEAWPRLPDVSPPLPGSVRAPTSFAQPEAGVPPVLRPQAVHILANMILALPEEIQV